MLKIHKGMEMWKYTEYIFHWKHISLKLDGTD
jgi:hypothetical protein